MVVYRKYWSIEEDQTPYLQRKLSLFKKGELPKQITMDVQPVPLWFTQIYKHGTYFPEFLNFPTYILYYLSKSTVRTSSVVYVSFDAVSLFSRVPTNFVIDVAHPCLKEDQTLPNLTAKVGPTYYHTRCS